MTPLKAALLVAALAAPAALAGCVGTASAGWDNLRANAGAAPAEIPARSALDEAEREAARWDPAARLTGIFAMEASRAMDGGESFGTDARVANGRAPAWAFEYVTPEATLTFLVRADRSIEDRSVNASDTRDEHAEAVGDWTLDSDDAVDALLADERFADAARRAAWSMDAFGRENGTSVWVITLLDDNMAGAVGVVDAATGEVIEVAVWDTPGWGSGDWGAWGGWGMGAGNVTHEETFEGDLVLVAPEARHEFPVEARGQSIAVAMRAFPHASLGLEVLLLDPLGQEIPLTSSASTISVFDERMLHGEATMPGTHTLVVRLPAPGAYAHYTARVTVGEPGVFDWTSAWAAPTATGVIDALRI